MPASGIRRVNAALDERLRSQSFLRDALDHIFPDNWSFMLGEVALYCFILLVLSGVYLTLFFDPSDTEISYHGSYLPLEGQSVSLAYDSTVRLSLEIRGGLLFRQIHHWSADIFLAAIVVHLCRVFFTGAFRKPRDINWMVGLTMFILSLFNGFTGYSLPGDLLSGLGLRIAYSISLSVPVLGNWLAYLFFGGQYPSDQLTHRLFIAHVLVAPMLIAALLGLHLALIWRQKHTQFSGPGRSQKKLVGSNLWPTYTARSLGLFAAVAGVMVLLGSLVQINPIWLYGPYKPQSATIAAQPDWYVGWLEGSLRLFPAWRLHLFGYTVSEVFWPAVALPIFTFILLYLWPALERWWASDLLSHNLLDRPRDRPVRTAFGVAGLSLYLVLLVAGAQDVFAQLIRVTQPPLTLTLRGLAVGLPIVSGAVTWKICRDLAAAGPPSMGEEPVGPADAASAPPKRYLPDRVRYEQPASPGRNGKRRVLAAAASGVLAVAVAGGLRMRHRQRNGR